MNESNVHTGFKDMGGIECLFDAWRYIRHNSCVQMVKRFDK